MRRLIMLKLNLQFNALIKKSRIQNSTIRAYVEVLKHYNRRYFMCKVAYFLGFIMIKGINISSKEIPPC